MAKVSQIATISEYHCIYIKVEWLRPRLSVSDSKSVGGLSDKVGDEEGAGGNRTALRGRTVLELGRGREAAWQLSSSLAQTEEVTSPLDSRSAHKHDNDRGLMPLMGGRRKMS